MAPTSWQQPIVPSWLEPGSEQVITERPGHRQGAAVEIKNSTNVFHITGGRLLTMDSHIALDPGAESN
jgi:hypothetical protein